MTVAGKMAVDRVNWARPIVSLLSGRRSGRRCKDKISKLDKKNLSTLHSVPQEEKSTEQATATETLQTP